MAESRPASDAAAKRRSIDAAAERRSIDSTKSQAILDHYDKAWAEVSKVVNARPSPEVLHARTDLAMAWVRSLDTGVSLEDWDRRIEGWKVVTDTVLPPLEEALGTAAGTRAADIRAHRAWAKYLRSWSANEFYDPSEELTDVLREDPNNPHANVMLALDVDRETYDVTAMTRYFAAALASGREHEYVRRSQLRTYASRGGVNYHVALIRVWNERLGNSDNFIVPALVKKFDENDAAVRDRACGGHPVRFEVAQHKSDRLRQETGGDRLPASSQRQGSLASMNNDPGGWAGRAVPLLLT